MILCERFCKLKIGLCLLNLHRFFENSLWRKIEVLLLIAQLGEQSCFVLMKHLSQFYKLQKRYDVFFTKSKSGLKFLFCEIFLWVRAVPYCMMNFGVLTNILYIDDIQN